MKCSNCGTALAPGMTSCPTCGLQFSVPVPGQVGFQQQNGRQAWPWILGGCGLLGCLPAIAIMAAILFPVFAVAREKAREVGCSSNEKQMALSLMQYAEDNDGALPVSSAWMDKIHTYTHQDFTCPDLGQPGHGLYGYAYNSQIGSKNISSFPAPGNVAAIYDSTNTARNASDAMTSLPSPPRHRGGNNIVYLDGHVTLVGPKSTQ
jgi:prepilin-type processing-associated H-X9-DG protein